MAAPVRIDSFISQRTYAASGTFTPAATPTDMVTIIGSATTLVRVISVHLATTNTAAGSQQYLLVKRSAANTTGTFVAATNVPLDSGIVAATAVVGHYTANPGGLGAAVGTVHTMRLSSPAAIPATFGGVNDNPGFELLPRVPLLQFVLPITLRGIAETLAVNFNGAALVLGQTHAYTVVWTEV